MSAYSNPPTPPYATSGIYTERIPWYQRTTSAHHRPFGAFHTSRPYTPEHMQQHTTPGQQVHSAEELEEARRQAAWLEWQGHLATTGGPAAPCDTASDTSSCDDEQRGIGMPDSVRRVIAAVVVGVVSWTMFAKRVYLRNSAAFARWYWLRLTEYRQSRWPEVYRRTCFWAKFFLCAMLVLLVVAIKIHEYMTTEFFYEPVIMDRSAREYRIWSVTKPRCPVDCYDPSKDN